MDITLAGTGLTYRPNDDQLGRVSLEFAAFDGEVGTGQLPIPDAEAAITVAGGRLATVEEGATLIGNQYIVDQDRDRGPMPAGTARQYSFGVMDANCLLGGFVVLLSRPAETDYARVMAFAALYLPSADTTWVLNASTVTMPKKHYDTDGGWAELITDLVEFTGKTLFLHDKADGSGLCLHYHLPTSGHTCGLTISDVAGAEDRVTVFAPWSPTRQRTSVDLVNTVRGRDQNGRTHTSSDPTSITAHNVDGLKHQALIDFDTTSGADLTVKTNALLASQKDEQDTYTCQIGPLDEDALALIRVGDRITVTSSVMGLTASAQRIAHMTLTVAIGENGRARAGWWMAALEMGAPVRRRARVKGSTRGIIVITNPPIGPIDDDGKVMICVNGNWCEPYDATISAGASGTTDFGCGANTTCSIAATTITVVQNQPTTGVPIEGLVGTDCDYDTPSEGVFSGTLAVAGMGASAYPDYREQNVHFRFNYSGGDPGNLPGFRISRRHHGGFSGHGTFLTILPGAGGSGGAGDIDIALDPELPYTILFKLGVSTISTIVKVKVWLAGFVEPDWLDTATRPSNNAPNGLRLRFNAARTDGDLTTIMRDITWCYSADIADVPPAFAGAQYGPVFIATADGTTSTFDLPAYPGTGYVPGSLMVFVDGVWQPVTSETDAVGPPGTFDLGNDPDAGDVIDAAWRVPP